MSQDGNIRENLKIGMEVEINPQGDRTRKELFRGQIQELLTNNPQHPHGILVRLLSGEIGRVKKILSNSFVSEESRRSTDTNKAFLREEQDLKELVSNGENHFVEFKSSILWSEGLKASDEGEVTSYELKEYGTATSRFIIAKTLAAMLNSDGGHLIIGIKESKSANNDEIIGIESEFHKLKDPCADGYRRMITDKIIKLFFPSYIFNHFNDYLEIVFDKINEKSLCWIRINKSDNKVFLNIKGKELFFIRVDATTRQIIGEKIVDYCNKRFN